MKNVSLKFFSKIQKRTIQKNLKEIKFKKYTEVLFDLCLSFV
jgi:hypothetical protein